jgi:hypothetical protein
MAGAQFQGLPACQRGEAGRQLVGVRHPRPFDQDRDDADVAGQRGLDLQAHEVVGVVQASLSVLVGDREPLLTDQRQEHVAGADRGGDLLDEVVAESDRVDVFEDLVAAVAVGESVEQPASLPGGLLPPVADEHAARRRCIRVSHQPHLVAVDGACGQGARRTSAEEGGSEAPSTARCTPAPPPPPPTRTLSVEHLSAHGHIDSAGAGSCAVRRRTSVAGPVVIRPRSPAHRCAARHCRSQAGGVCCVD